MITVAALCAVAGLILGLNTNVRVFLLIAFVITAAAFLAGLSKDDGSVWLGMAWAVTAIVTTQTGYMLMAFLRAGWLAAQAKERQPGTLVN